MHDIVPFIYEPMICQMCSNFYELPKHIMNKLFDK